MVVCICDVAVGTTLVNYAQGNNSPSRRGARISVKRRRFGSAACFGGVRACGKLIKIYIFTPAAALFSLLPLGGGAVQIRVLYFGEFIFHVQ